MRAISQPANPVGSPAWVNRVAPTGQQASPNVRYVFNSDRICASQRTDASAITGREQMQQAGLLFYHLVGEDVELRRDR